MATASTVLLLLLLLASAISSVFGGGREMELLRLAHTQVAEARTWVDESLHHHHQQSGVNVTSSMLSSSLSSPATAAGVALGDCAKLYEESEQRMNELVSKAGDDGVSWWVSSVMSNHRTCLDGLKEKGYDVEADEGGLHKNLTSSLQEALHLLVMKNKQRVKAKPKAKSKYIRVVLRT
ncbi:hypothetical protein QN277_024516 [Acacia crassicarpa]|uniref:Pectinesterase inhibitor domain-containing protein n=1 Tax=Acacia crassicarpa TaxID=499986 RepID=A0AAE1JEZ4_9FABA|nr:hypothetical protein QN277_024516 [Acacia crassicarpa]